MKTQQLSGTIFDIQRMSLHDGPGIRTTVFFKGCSMHCFWCHNPESLSCTPDIQYFSERCIKCGLCQTVCEHACHEVKIADAIHNFHREQCIKCGKCADICPSGSLVKTGKHISLENLLETVSRDIPFFIHSGGGVTASGGEPLLQPEFIAAFFRKLHSRKIHTALETALNVPPEALLSVLPYTDFVLADMKHPDPLIHKSVTGVSNERIIKNFAILDQSNTCYCIRIPVIPGVNDTEEIMVQFNTIIRTLKHPQYLELMPYHAFGIGKYDSLSTDHSKLTSIKPPSKDTLIKLANCFDSIKVIFRNGSKIITITGGVLCE